MVTLDGALRLLKLCAVLAYAGGLVAAFVASAPLERSRAVHRVASPALLLVWVAGYLMTQRLLVPLTSMWILGALALSLLSQLALVHAAARQRRTVGAFLAAALPLLATMALMVFRPGWSVLGIEP